MNGKCDIVIIGDGFGQSNEARFLKYANTVKNNLLKREPFTSLSHNLNFWFINAKQSLGCNYTAEVNRALICDWNKVKKALGNTPMNVMQILSWKTAIGGGGGFPTAIGMGQMKDPYAGNPSYCTHDLEARLLDGISPHEFGHGFGCDHDFTNQENVMSFATNGGCFLVGKPFTPAHQTIISNFINKAITT